MNIVCTPWRTCARGAALALTTLVLGCGDSGGGDEDGSATMATSDPTADTDPTTAPTSGDESGSSGGSSESGTDETGAVEAVDYKTDIQKIWDASCVQGCHNAAGSAQANGPYLEADKSYAMIVGKMSPTVPALNLVEPGDLDGSYLWHKVNGTFEDVGGTGLVMPFGAMLAPEDLARIKKWIEDGAQP